MKTLKKALPTFSNGSDLFYNRSSLQRITCISVSVLAAAAAIAMEYLTYDRCLSFSIVYSLLIILAMLSVCQFVRMCTSKKAVAVICTAVMAVILAGLNFSSNFFSYMDLNPDNISSIARSMGGDAIILHLFAFAFVVLVSHLLDSRKTEAK